MSGMAGVMMVASRISMKRAPATSRATPRGITTSRCPQLQCLAGARRVVGRRSGGSEVPFEEMSPPESEGPVGFGVLDDVDEQIFGLQVDCVFQACRPSEVHRQGDDVDA